MEWKSTIPDSKKPGRVEQANEQRQVRDIGSFIYWRNLAGSFKLQLIFGLNFNHFLKFSGYCKAKDKRHSS